MAARHLRLTGVMVAGVAIAGLLLMHALDPALFVEHGGGHGVVAHALDGPDPAGLGMCVLALWAVAGLRSGASRLSSGRPPAPVPTGGLDHLPTREAEAGRPLLARMCVLRI